MIPRHPASASNARFAASARVSSIQQARGDFVPAHGQTLRGKGNEVWVVKDIRGGPKGDPVGHVELMREDDFHSGDVQETLWLSLADFREFCRLRKLRLA